MSGHLSTKWTERFNMLRFIGTCIGIGIWIIIILFILSLFFL